MISYEIALGLVACRRADSVGQLEPARYRGRTRRNFLGIYSQLEYFLRRQFVAFFIYMMAAYAETNRIPFDLPEAETELVAGYHTEYSAMKFAMFFMAEYANMITVACLASLCSWADGAARCSARRSLQVAFAGALVFAADF